VEKMFTFVIAIAIAKVSNFLVSGVQIPYDTMTPLQAAVGVRQVGKKSGCSVLSTTVL
jgi:hypothetical protein